MPAMWLCLAMLAGGAADSFAFKVSTRKPQDDVDVKIQDGRALVTVRSATGIGAAVIERTAGHWPSTVVVRLELTGLESLVISAGETKLGASVTSHSGYPRRVHVLRKDGREDAVQRGSRHWIEVRALDRNGRPANGLPERGGCFEVTLPRVLFETTPPSLSVEWIDFYRG
jgi:hypothetical protein